MSHTFPYPETEVVALPGASERETETSKDSACMTGAWASRRQVARHLIQSGSVFRGDTSGDFEMCNSDRELSPLLEGEHEPEGILIESLTQDLPEQDSFLPYESDEDDALRIAYATRYNLVLDSNAPHIAPHIVITPPEDNSQDYYTPWLNNPGPQWPTHLMVVIPPNALDRTLVYMDSSYSSRQPATPEAKTVFRLSKFKALVSSLTREHEYMHNIVNALQRHHRKAAAFAASEAARSFLTCNPYRCPSEKPFRWTDPAEPFLQRKNQYRGTIVIESPSPFTVPHIIINEPPPQDPWIPWHNATNSPQDHGFGRYLVVPHRLVLYINAPQGLEDYWGSPFACRQASASEHLDPQAYREDMDYEGSSSSESEPGTPDPDSLMDDFLLDGNNADFHAEILRVSENVNIFDSLDESPWTAIMDRYSAALLRAQEPPLECGGTADFRQPIEGVTFDEEDELPPFDDWYQNIATRIVTVAT